MATTTGIVLAIGGITITNRTIFNNKPMDWRVPIATGLAAVMFAGGEKVWPEGARMLAWTALVAITFTRVDPDVPSPVESALSWWEEGGYGTVTFPGGKRFEKGGSAARPRPRPREHS